MRLFELYQELPEATTKEAISAAVRELMIIVQTEGLQPQLSELYLMVARAYLNVGEFDDAREYAGTAEEYCIRYGSEEHDNVEGMRELWEDINSAELLTKMGPHEREYYEDY